MTQENGMIRGEDGEKIVGHDPERRESEGSRTRSCVVLPRWGGRGAGSEFLSLGPGTRAATGGAQSAWIHFFPVKNQVLQF
jgi:hypothetical protein